LIPENQLVDRVILEIRQLWKEVKPVKNRYIGSECFIPGHHIMNYLVAVLASRLQAEGAYTSLEREGFPTNRISILGRGYQSADEFGLINPDNEAAVQSRRLAYWLIPFGFAAGYAFNVLTGIEILSWANGVINNILGGLFGAGAGALGALFSGGAAGWTVASGDALAYRNRLNSGKYLIILRGSDAEVELATRIIRQFEPENLQGYVEPVNAEA
jgi:hypothetical protein